jgi:RNA polymerase sigma-70 factor (ECF subfamily)
MNYYNTSQNQIIKALKEGKSDAYSYLVNTYHHKLCVYALGLTNNYNLAEDIVQNVFISVWNNRLKLKEDFSIKNYLYKSVYNEFIDQYRKRKLVFPLEKKYIEALSTIVEEEKENEQSIKKLIAIVKKEIENLPPKCKQVFLLSKEDGLTNIEIAEHLDVSIKNVEGHITKAFKILRNTLGNKTKYILFLLFGLENNYQNFQSIDE